MTPQRSDTQSKLFEPPLEYYLKTEEGDRLNAILAAAGYNMRKLLSAFLYALREFVRFLQNWQHEINECQYFQRAA